MTAPERADGRLLAIARRYEPAVITVVVVLVVLLVAPRVTDRPQEARSFAAPTLEPSDGESDLVASPSERAPVFSRPPATAQRRPSPPSPPVGSVTAPQPKGRPSPTVTTTQPPPPAALEIVETGWSGSDAGLPIAGFDVPEGSLPVSSAFGEPDRRSYLRLSGEETVLTLDVVQHPIGSRFTSDAAVWLCPITEQWEGERGMAAEDAPSYGCVTRAVGKPGDDAWTFDLSRFANPARKHGFVLVAASESPDFQVLFADPTSDDTED